MSQVEDELTDLIGQFAGALGENKVGTNSGGGAENPFTLDDDASAHGAAAPHPLDDVFGAPTGSPSQAPFGAAPSVDLDLLGSPGNNPGLGPLARVGTASADHDINLLSAEDVTMGFAPQQPTTSPVVQAPLPQATGPLGTTATSTGLGSVSSAGGSQRGGPLQPSPGPYDGEAGPSTSASAGGQRAPGGLGAAPAGMSLAGGITPAAEEQQLVRVWLKDPEKQEGTNKLGIRTTYFTYLVRTESALPGMRADGAEVRRRFSEFDSLHKLVKAQYRGYIIPPLPEKSFIESKLAHEDFLRLRRADLQAFLRGIVSHPVLRDSEALKLFLLQPGELSYNPAWIALLHSIGSQPDHSDGQGGGVLSGGAAASGGSATSKAAAGLSSLVSWVRHSVLAGGSKRELDEDEQQLRHAKELLRDLERLLQLSCESARVLCSHMEAVAGDLVELGRNMGMMSKWEEALRSQSGTYTEAGFSAAKRAADCRQMSMATARQNGVWKAAAVKTAASLVSLHDYYILMPEAVAALEERERCLAHIHAMEDELAAKQGELARGTGGNSRGERRAYSLTSSVERLEEALRAAREQYALIKQRNVEELRRLHLEREQDFHDMMATFASVMAQQMAASADMWRTTARLYSGEGQVQGAAPEGEGQEGDAGAAGEGREEGVQL